MSKPVITDKWAGNFDCTICKRKRLVGSEFSKKALDRYRKTGAELKCKSCIAAQEERERHAAALKQQQAHNTTNSSSPEQDIILKTICSSCKESLPTSDFNRNQLAKKDKARCRQCVQRAIDEEERNRTIGREQKIQDLREKLHLMNVNGDVKGKLQYETELSALEAEHVTGLKPVVMGKGGRGRGSWMRKTGRGRQI